MWDFASLTTNAVTEDVVWRSMSDKRHSRVRRLKVADLKRKTMFMAKRFPTIYPKKISEIQNDLHTKFLLLRQMARHSSRVSVTLVRRSKPVIL